MKFLKVPGFRKGILNLTWNRWKEGELNSFKNFTDSAKCRTFFKEQFKLHLERKSVRERVRVEEIVYIYEREKDRERRYRRVRVRIDRLKLAKYETCRLLVQN